MPDLIKTTAEVCAAIIEALGIGIITVLALYVIIFAIYQQFTGVASEEIFRQTRQRLGRIILLGLEFLVAADIIYTVAVELTFATVVVLAIIVVIRTFLSFTLDLELTGRWPWQAGDRS